MRHGSRNWVTESAPNPVAPRAATALLIAMMLAGPALVALEWRRHPDGDAFQDVRAQTTASVCLITAANVAYDDLTPRADHPGIDRLAAFGIDVRRAYAPTGAEPAAAASLYTGLLPLSHGLRSFAQRCDPAAITLALALQHRGLRTAAFSNLPLFTPGLGLERGFDACHFEAGTDPLALANLAADFLAGVGPTHSFVWIHYQPPAGNTGAPGLDAIVARMLDVLREQRRLEGTFVIAAGSSPSRPAAPVPLVWRIPGRHVSGSTRIGPCSTLDIPMTLLHLFGRVGYLRGAGRALTDGPKALYSGVGFAGLAPYELTDTLDSEPRLGLRGGDQAIDGPRHGATTWRRADESALGAALRGDGRTAALQRVMQQQLGELFDALPAPCVTGSSELTESQRSWIDQLGLR